MISLLGLLVSTAVSLLWGTLVVSLAPTTRRAFWARLLFVPVYGLTLLLALRFGARTYPGIWVSEFAVLNDLFNSPHLFLIGYALTVLGCLIDAITVVLNADGQRRAASLLNPIKWTGLGLALLVTVFGFYFAVVLGRLPA